MGSCTSDLINHITSQKKSIPQAEERPVEDLCTVISNNALLKSVFNANITNDEFVTLVDAMEILYLEKGHLLINKGDNPDGMYILYSGQLKVTKDGTVLGNVQPLECVGELGFLYGSPRLATVAATQPSTVYYLSKRSFNKIVESVEKSFEKIPLFSVLDVDSKRDMFPAAKILSVGTGDYIARKDDNPTMFFIVLKGLVSFGDKIYRPYDYFGHSELLKSAQYKSSIIVRRTATLLAISNKGFRSSAFSSVRHALTKQQKSAMESEGAQQLQDNGGSPLRRRSSASKNLLSTPSSGISKSPRPSKAFRKADDDGGLVRFEDITTSPDKSAMYSDDNPCIMCVPL